RTGTEPGRGRSPAPFRIPVEDPGPHGRGVLDSRRLARMPPRPHRAAIGLTLGVVLLSGLVPRARAEYRVIETEGMVLHYPSPTLRYLAPYTARCFENSLRFHRKPWGYAPSEKVSVFLDDFGDYGNAGVWVNPRNSMVVHAAPTNFVYETGPSNERM